VDNDFVNVLISLTNCSSSNGATNDAGIVMGVDVVVGRVIAKFAAEDVNDVEDGNVVVPAAAAAAATAVAAVAAAFANVNGDGCSININASLLIIGDKYRIIQYGQSENVYKYVIYVEIFNVVDIIIIVLATV
jgi:hypothetical protein